jgi:hypothetical protein
MNQGLPSLRGAPLTLGHDQVTGRACRHVADDAIMVMPRNHAHEPMVGPVSKPFPQSRPHLEIYLVPEYADELLAEDLITVDGAATTSVERTLLDLATCTTGPDLWRMLDNALAGRLTTIAGLNQAIARHPRHKGSNRLATFVGEWSGSDSQLHHDRCPSPNATPDKLQARPGATQSVELSGHWRAPT